MGRNKTTMISDDRLAIYLCNVGISTDGNMFLEITQRQFQHRVHLNGKLIEASQGEKIPLYRV